MVLVGYPTAIPPHTVPRAVLAGQLLGHALAWEHRDSGQVCDDHTLDSLAQGGWQVDGHLLAGSDGDYAVFLAGFLEAYHADQSQRAGSQTPE